MHCAPVNVVYGHKLSFLLCFVVFFLSLDERRRATRPRSHLYRSCCLESRSAPAAPSGSLPVSERTLEVLAAPAVGPRSRWRRGPGVTAPEVRRMTGCCFLRAVVSVGVLTEGSVTQRQGKPAKIPLSVRNHRRRCRPERHAAQKPGRRFNLISVAGDIRLD